MDWRNPYPRPWQDAYLIVQEVKHIWNVTSHTALRVRAGARHACARLRRERDTSRRNLAALEWLSLRGYPVGQEPGGHRVSASPEPNGDPWFDSWEECAAALGWEG